MLASTSLTKEGVEGIISTPDCLVTRHLAIRLDAMFQTVEFPAGIANLDTSLANVDGDALALQAEFVYVKPFIFYKSDFLVHLSQTRHLHN